MVSRQKQNSNNCQIGTGKNLRGGGGGRKKINPNWYHLTSRNFNFPKPDAQSRMCTYEIKKARMQFDRKEGRWGEEEGGGVTTSSLFWRGVESGQVHYFLREKEKQRERNRKRREAGQGERERERGREREVYCLSKKSCDREMMGRTEQKRRHTSISLLTLRADNVTIGQLYAWPVVGAGAGLTVVWRSLCGVAIKATCAALTVVTFRVVLTDAAA